MLSNQSVATLVDMLENRISVMDITDRDDMRELMGMKRILAELSAAAGTPAVRTLEIDFEMPRRGRRRKMYAAA